MADHNHTTIKDPLKVHPLQLCTVTLDGQDRPALEWRSSTARTSGERAAILADLGRAYQAVVDGATNSGATSSHKDNIGVLATPDPGIEQPQKETTE